MVDQNLFWLMQKKPYHLHVNVQTVMNGNLLQTTKQKEIGFVFMEFKVKSLSSQSVLRYGSWYSGWWIDRQVYRMSDRSHVVL